MRKPKWLKSNKLGSKNTARISGYLRKYGLHSVCESAKCPNKGECFENGTSTFMILGDVCTRNCTFCAVDKNKEQIKPPDPEEPQNIARMVKDLNLKHVVITTVTRDDLDDGGASHFAKVVKAIRNSCDINLSIELLISDLKGNWEALDTILNANPDVLNHNLETIPRLYPTVRPMADYQRSLQLLKTVKQRKKNMLTKSGLMVGLGEKDEELYKVMKDLIKINVNFLTIGQYMQPSKNHHPVLDYIRPEKFDEYRKKALKLGFDHVESGPLVRSSYHAEKAREFLTSKKNKIKN